MDGNRTTATIPTTGTLSRRLGALAAAAPAAPAIEHVAGGRIARLDRAALLRRAARLAAGLRAVRPGPGADPPVVPIVLRHDPDLVPLFVAGLLAGVRPCVLAWPTPRLDRGRWAESFRRLLEAVEAPLVVTRGDLASVVDSAAPTGARAIDVADLLAATDDLRSRRHEIAAGGLLDGMDDVEAALDPTAVAFLQFSSGTTGTPKGLGLSHRAVLEQVAAYARAIDLGPGDRVVSWLPLYHDMGLVAATLLPLLAGVPVTMLDPMEWVARPALLLEHVARSRATLCWQPNFAFEFLARAVPREAGVPDL